MSSAPFLDDSIENPSTPAEVQEREAVFEVKRLDTLEQDLLSEFEGRADMTVPQRLTLLSEIRKLIYLRALIKGLITPREGNE
jgi:hypothetical protein